MAAIEIPKAAADSAITQSLSTQTTMLPWLRRRRLPILKCCCQTGQIVKLLRRGAAGTSLCDARHSRGRVCHASLASQSEPRWAFCSGEQITHANMSNDVPIVRDLPETLHTPRARLHSRSSAQDVHGFSPS